MRPSSPHFDNMLISRWRLREVLDEQKKKDVNSRGYQPDLTAGCFYNLKKEGKPVERTEVYCEKCSHYDLTCKFILGAFEIKEDLFKKSIGSQVKEGKILILCHNGAKRSPTAVSVARDIAKERGLNLKFEDGSSNAIPKTDRNYAEKYLRPYKQILVAESDILEKLEALGIERQKIQSLDIPDKYEKGDKELVYLLRTKLEALLR